MDATPPALSNRGDLALGFFHFASFPYKPPSARRCYELKQRTLWGMIVASLRQSERPPADFLTDLVRRSPLCLLTMALKVPRAVTDHGLGSDNVKGDGLCGFRAAYRAYLRSTGARDTDPDLHDHGQRVAFLAWLAQRQLAMTRQNRHDITLKIQKVVDWVTSDAGFGGEVANPQYRNTGDTAWFSLNYFGPPEALEEAPPHDQDGALFCGDNVPITAVQAPTETQIDRIFNINGAPASVTQSYCVSAPASYSHLTSQLSGGTPPTLIFDQPVHFWLFDMPGIGEAWIDEALCSLGTLTIDRVVDAIAHPPPPREETRPSSSSSSSKGNEIEVSDDSGGEEVEEQPPRDCRTCGPGTTVLGKDRLTWTCGACRTDKGPNTFKHHCLQCKEYFCTKCPETRVTTATTTTLVSPLPLLPPRPPPTTTAATSTPPPGENNPALRPDQAAPQAASLFVTTPSAPGDPPDRGPGEGPN